MEQKQNLILSPHVDDELLGCFSYLNDKTFVMECGADEFHVVDREERLRELQDLADHCKFSYEVFDNIVNNYDDTIFIEEALHRLVEINYNLGLLEESKKIAKILGYNYNSSEWYENSYSLINKDYKIEQKKLKKASKDKETSLVKKMINRILNR